MIAAIITVFVFSRVRKLSMGLLCDTAGLGLVLGQVIGRWGNFFNREAFGGYTDGLFAMQLPLSAVRSSDVTDSLLQHVVEVNGISYIQVHPTFLYESLWNLILLILLILFTRHKRFDGEVFLLYLAGYGIGRFWIESLRTEPAAAAGHRISGVYGTCSTSCGRIGFLDHHLAYPPAQKNSIRYIWMGKSSTRFHVWRIFLEKTAAVGSFSRKTGNNP